MVEVKSKKFILIISILIIVSLVLAGLYYQANYFDVEYEMKQTITMCGAQIIP